MPIPLSLESLKFPYPYCAPSIEGGMYMSGALGTFKKVDLREYWKDEARDFTPWLAIDTNLELLGETLGLDIELEDTDVSVGNFRADLVAKDINSERIVIIENQLEKTNHDHLGKIITYASGLGADVIVWICKKVTDEHRNAIDWLNEISDEKIAFFALEIELWRINDSPPAPKFNIVGSPNEWAKTIKESTRTTKMTNTKILQGEFWTGLTEYMNENGTFLKLRKPRAQHWYSLAIGRSKFNIALTVNTQKNRIGCEIYIRGENAKKAFYLLHEDKDNIESEFGTELEWNEIPDGQDCRILLFTDGDIQEKEKWEKYFQWCQEKAERFFETFSDRIKKLSL